MTGGPALNQGNPNDIANNKVNHHLKIHTKNIQNTTTSIINRYDKNHENLQQISSSPPSSPSSSPPIIGTMQTSSKNNNNNNKNYNNNIDGNTNNTNNNQEQRPSITSLGTIATDTTNGTSDKWVFIVVINVLCFLYALSTTLQLPKITNPIGQHFKFTKTRGYDYCRLYCCC